MCSVPHSVQIPALGCKSNRRGIVQLAIFCRACGPSHVSVFAKPRMNSCNYPVSHYGTRISHASNPPPTSHCTGTCAHYPVWGCSAEYGPGADSHDYARRCVGKPTRPVWRGGDGERLVRRLETRSRSHSFRPDCQRLLLAYRAAQRGRVTHGHHPPLAVLFCGHVDLLAQRCLAGSAGQFAPLRAEFPVAGDERTLRHLPL